MFHFLAMVIVLQGPAAAGTPADAAVLLSRFPAGAVPELPTVLRAIETIAESGKDEHLPLLRSLIAQEAGEVERAATRAVATITGEPAVAEAEPEEGPEARVDPRPDSGL